MALRFFDSFDIYTSPSQRWTSTSAGPSISATYRRWGSGGGLNCGYGTGVNATVMKQLDAQPTWCVGMAFYVPGPNCTLLALADGGTPQLSLMLDDNGRLALRFGNAFNPPTLGTGTTVIAYNTWNYVELSATINNTTGSYEVRLNGVTEMSATGIDTQSTANASADRVYVGQVSGLFGMSGFITGAFDDVYICDGQGSAPWNTFLGDVRIQALMPTADGDLSQLTPSTGTAHYALVDEVPPNDDTDYVSSANAGDTDLFQLGDVAAVSGSILGLQVLAYARKDDAGTRTLAPVLKTGGVEHDGTAVGLGTSYTYLRQLWETNPGTGLPWTIADVNALQAGVKVG